MISKKPILVLLITMITIFCISCSKETPSSDNSNLQELANTVTPTVEKDNTQEAKDDVSTTETDSKLQQIIDNNEFLNSFEGSQYQISAYYFVKAFLNGDYKYISENLIDNNNLDEYDYKDQFSKIECMYFRLHEYNKQEQTVHGEFVIQLTKDSGYFYLEFNMQLIENKWKIINYQLDA